MSAEPRPAAAPRPREGLFDRLTFPERLTGRVASPGPDPRIHGYSVEQDLVWNIDFTALCFLSLTGELPSPGEREALSAALTLLAPMHVGEAPAHAAVLARIAGAPATVIPGVAALALGELSKAEQAELDGLARFLEGEASAPPEAALLPSPSVNDEQSYQRLRAASADWLGEPLALPGGVVLRRVACGHALLYRLGLGDPYRLVALSTLARLPCVLAEALCVRPGGVSAYPARLPAYRYVEDGPSASPPSELP